LILISNEALTISKLANHLPAKVQLFLDEIYYYISSIILNTLLIISDRFSWSKSNSLFSASLIKTFLTYLFDFPFLFCEYYDSILSALRKVAKDIREMEKKQLLTEII